MALLLRICCCTIIITSVVAYNFDVNNILIYEDLLKSESSRNSYFGFAVAFRPIKYWKDRSEILIGAPRANISESTYNEPGSVFRCNIGSRCTRFRLSNNQGDLKMSDNSWIGGTIVTAFENTTLPATVVCGWRWRPTIFEELPGACYQSYYNQGKKGPTNEVAVQLPNGRVPDTDYLGNVGMSAYITQDHSDVKIIMSGPGLEGGYGLTIRNDGVMFEDRNYSYNRYSHKYFGYAATSGYYFNKLQRVHAMGGPRAEKLMGGVTLYNFKDETANALQWETLIRGEQIGAYFGASLASCDINGDGKDELLVGAPFWSNIMNDAANSDLGRIYVYRSTNEYQKSMINVQTINGEVVGERFGTVITCLGDIDHDGFGDIAVSGPYNSNGIVYIFNGAQTGQLQPYSQKLLSPENVRGFGISITQPRDIDQNGFADIAVGAYLSGHVVVYRSKIVASIVASLTFKKKGIGSDYRMNYHVVELCSTYDVFHSVNQPPRQLNMTMKFENVDEIAKWTTPENSGDFTRLQHVFPCTLNIRDQSCNTYTVGIKKRRTDFVMKPKLTASVKIRTNPGKDGILTIGADETRGTDDFDKRQITASPTNATLTLPPRWNCQSSVCQEDLSVHLMSNLKNNAVFIPGSKSTIDLVISVENSGEDAFDTQTQIYFPSSLSFMNSNSSNCVDCDSQTKNNTCIECSVDQLLVPNQRESIRVELDARQLTTTNYSTLYIKTSTSAAKLIGRGIITNANLQISCEMNVNISLIGESKQISYRYIKAEQKIIDFKHVYTIRNLGISPIGSAALTLFISTHWNQVEIAKLKSIKGCSKMHERFDVTPTSEISTSNSQSSANMSCQNDLTRCVAMKCWVGPLNTTADQATVILEFQLNTAELPPNAASVGHGISLETSGRIEFLLPESSCIISGDNTATSSAKTQFIQFTIPIAEQGLPWYIILASILLGLLLIALLGFGLYKLGFFVRNKKEDLDRLRNGDDIGLCQNQDQQQQQVE